MFIVFLALIIGPIVAGKFMKKLPSIPLNLLQPTGQNNNDTSSSPTGSGIDGFGAHQTGAAATAAASASSTG